VAERGGFRFFSALSPGETLSPERFRQVEEVFDAAADTPTGERAAVLDRLCAEDLDLRTAVEALLGALPAAPTQIQSLIGEAAGEVVGQAGPRTPPRRIGPYRLVCELGRGGMGAVYLAVRDDDEYQRAVAIKLLHGGLETAQAVARFRDERQILASLEHPGIVRLLDGGSTAERLPYLVMEHVVGASITEWCETRGLDVRARVELFRKVCAAVAYAHQQLVVHRDLKPENILVTVEGEPKLLDFGIAKLLDPSAGREASTGTGMRLLTPEYASPEQVRGEPVSTATDVYALGAVLYELLSGAFAQRVKGEGIEALRSILEVEPQRPSLVAPRARQRAIAGDLDNIVMKALRKEVPLRYASVEQLSADLQRHLDGLPVLARAGTWTYRVGKLVRRSRGVIAAAGVVLASLTGATVVSVRQAHRADAQARRADEQARRAGKRFDEVRRLANSMLFEVDGKIENLEGATAARQLIVQRALTYLDGLAGEADDDPGLSRELAAAYTKTGDIQGSVLGPSLGRPRDALASYEKADRLLVRLVAAGHDGPETRWARVRALYGIGAASRLTNDLVRARASAQAAIDLAATLPEDQAFDYEVVARGLAQILNMATEDAAFEAARRDVDALLQLATRWYGARAAPEARYWIGVSHEAEGGIRSMTGDPDGAISEYRAAIQAFAALSAEHPENAAYRRELWFAHSILATSLSGVGDAKIWVPSLGDLHAAEREQREALSVAERLARRDTGDRRALLEMSEALDHLAALVGERDPAAALLLFRHAREAYAELPAPFRASAYAAQFERFGQCRMAVVLARLGRRAEAIEATERGLLVAAENARVEDASFEDRMGPWMCRYDAARARLALGDAAEAARLLGEVDAGLELVLASKPPNILPYVGRMDTLSLLAEIQAPQGCAHLKRASAAGAAWLGASTPYLKRRRDALDLAAAACGTPREKK
jgi:tetratricopeptide (TPR) repeat protein